MKILITGGAGFIGYHLSKALLTIKDNHIIGLDNLNDYYDVQLKKTDWNYWESTLMISQTTNFVTAERFQDINSSIPTLPTKRFYRISSKEKSLISLSTLRHKLE